MLTNVQADKSDNYATALVLRKRKYYYISCTKTTLQIEFGERSFILSMHIYHIQTYFASAVIRPSMTLPSNIADAYTVLHTDASTLYGKMASECRPNCFLLKQLAQQALDQPYTQTFHLFTFMLCYCLYLQ